MLVLKWVFVLLLNTIFLKTNITWKLFLSVYSYVKKLKLTDLNIVICIKDCIHIYNVEKNEHKKLSIKNLVDACMITSSTMTQKDQSYYLIAVSQKKKCLTLYTIDCISWKIIKDTVEKKESLYHFLDIEQHGNILCYQDFDDKKQKIIVYNTWQKKIVFSQLILEEIHECFAYDEKTFMFVSESKFSNLTVSKTAEDAVNYTSTS